MPNENQETHGTGATALVPPAPICSEVYSSLGSGFTLDKIEAAWFCQGPQRVGGSEGAAPEWLARAFNERTEAIVVIREGGHIAVYRPITPNAGASDARTADENSTN